MNGTEEIHGDRNAGNANQRDRARQELHFPVCDLPSSPEGQWPQLCNHKVDDHGREKIWHDALRCACGSKVRE